MSTEAMKLALEALISEYYMENSSFAKRVADIFKEAPAQPQQEPYGYVWFNKHMEHRFTRMEPHPDMRAMDIKPIYTSPPAQRKPLPDAQINAFFEGMEPNNGFWLSFARTIEAAHNIKEQNT